MSSIQPKISDAIANYLFTVNDDSFAGSLLSIWDAAVGSRNSPSERACLSLTLTPFLPAVYALGTLGYLIAKVRECVNAYFTTRPASQPVPSLQGRVHRFSGLLTVGNANSSTSASSETLHNTTRIPDKEIQRATQTLRGCGFTGNFLQWDYNMLAQIDPNDHSAFIVRATVLFQRFSPNALRNGGKESAALLIRDIQAMPCPQSHAQWLQRQCQAVLQELHGGGKQTASSNLPPPPPLLQQCRLLNTLPRQLQERLDAMGHSLLKSAHDAITGDAESVERFFEEAIRSFESGHITSRDQLKDLVALSSSALIRAKKMGYAIDKNDLRLRSFFHALSCCLQSVPYNPDLSDPSVRSLVVEIMRKGEINPGERLGEGGFGCVYTAQNVHNVAMKIFKGHKAASKSREAYAESCRFKGIPNTPSVLFWDGKHLYTQRISGPDGFEKYMNDRALSDTPHRLTTELVSDALGWLKGLRGLQERGVCHGDFKLENVIQNQLIDINNTVERNGAAYVQSRTRAFEAPESIAAHAKDALPQANEKLDTWSLGLTLLVALAPDREKDYLYQHFNMELQRCSKYDRKRFLDNQLNRCLTRLGRYSAPFKHLIQRCLVYVPQQRATLCEVQQHLNALSASIPR